MGWGLSFSIRTNQQSYKSYNRYPQVEVANLWIQFLVINRSDSYWNQYIAKGNFTKIFLLILILYFKNTQIVLDVGQELMLFVFLQVGQFWCPAPVTSMELAADSSGRELVCGDQLGNVHFFVVQDLHWSACSELEKNEWIKNSRIHVHVQGWK